MATVCSIVLPNLCKANICVWPFSHHSSLNGPGLRQQGQEKSKTSCQVPYGYRSIQLYCESVILHLSNSYQLSSYLLWEFKD